MELVIVKVLCALEHSFLKDKITSNFLSSSDIY